MPWRRRGRGLRRCLLAVLQTGRDAGRAAWAFTVLGLACAAHALYGLLAHLSGTNTILWFPKTAYHDVVTGTFVNRNTFATHAGLGLLCLAAALRRSLAAGPARSLPVRERVRQLLAVAPVRKALLLGAALLVGFAILLSESRAGAAAAMLALTAFLAILALRGGGLLRAAAVAAATLGVSLFFASLGEGLERRLWSAEADWQDRRLIAAETLDALRTAPLRGVGFGGFEAAHRAYRESSGRTTTICKRRLNWGCRPPSFFLARWAGWRSPARGVRCAGAATPAIRLSDSQPASWWARTPPWISACGYRPFPCFSR